MIRQVAQDAPLQPGRDQARAWAQHELQRPEYRSGRPGLLQQALQWLSDHLSGLHTPAFSPPLGTALIALAALAVAGIVLWRSGGTTRRARAQATDLFGVTSRSAADHRAAAEAAEAAGDLATAVLERFRALIRALADRELVPLSPGLTADEAARAAGDALPELAGEMRSAARAFDDIRYGDRPATRDQAATLRDLDERAARTRPRPLIAAEPR